VAGLGETQECVTARPLGINYERVASGDQNLVQCSFGDLERAIDDLTLLERERRLDRHHVAQLVFGDLASAVSDRAHILRIKNGEIVAHDAVQDNLEVARQLGVLAARNAASGARRVAPARYAKRW
jgi:hypothetical protein